jgi:hypothetical protein
MPQHLTAVRALRGYSLPSYLLLLLLIRYLTSPDGCIPRSQSLIERLAADLVLPGKRCLTLAPNRKLMYFFNDNHAVVGVHTGFQ